MDYAGFILVLPQKTQHSESAPAASYSDGCAGSNSGLGGPSSSSSGPRRDAHTLECVHPLCSHWMPNKGGRLRKRKNKKKVASKQKAARGAATSSDDYRGAGDSSDRRVVVEPFHQFACLFLTWMFLTPLSPQPAASDLSMLYWR